MKTICYIASAAGLLTVLIAAALPHTDYTAMAVAVGSVTIYGGFIEAELLNRAERKRARKEQEHARRRMLKLMQDDYCKQCRSPIKPDCQPSCAEFERTSRRVKESSHADI